MKGLASAYNLTPNTESTIDAVLLCAQKARVSTPQDLGKFAVAAGINDPTKLSELAYKARFWSERQLGGFVHGTKISHSSALYLFLSDQKERHRASLAFNLTDNFLREAKIPDVLHAGKTASLFIDNAPDKLGYIARALGITHTLQLVRFMVGAITEDFAKLTIIERRSTRPEYFFHREAMPNMLKLKDAHTASKFAKAAGIDISLKELAIFACELGLEPRTLGQFASKIGVGLDELHEFAHQAGLIKEDQCFKFRQAYGMTEDSLANFSTKAYKEEFL